MKQLFLSLSILFFASAATFACNDATFTFNSETDNGDGTFTYNVDLCTEMLGLEGIPDWFQLEFAGSSFTSVSSFSPASIFTSYPDEYQGNILGGDAVRWTMIDFSPVHSSNLLCTNITVITNGPADQITISYHDTYPSSDCTDVFIIPDPPCSVDAVTAGAQTCDSGTNTYEQVITVSYTNPPTSGTLDIAVSGVGIQSFPIGTSPQTVTLTSLPPTGGTVNVTVDFSADGLCSLTQGSLFTAPSDCATSCDPDNGTWD